VALVGTLIPVDRVAADRPLYSGKHKKHGMNLQVIASPDRDIVWVSGALPGSVHDKKAEWIWGVLAELEAAGLVTLADKGNRGSDHAKIPYIGKNKPESQKQVNRAHARLRAPGERANAQLKTLRILRKLRCCPWRAGTPAWAIHVLQAREAAGHRLGRPHPGPGDGGRLAAPGAIRRSPSAALRLSAPARSEGVSVVQRDSARQAPSR
jgi:DDE superfamily endonuclease